MGCSKLLGTFSSGDILANMDGFHIEDTGGRSLDEDVTLVLTSEALFVISVNEDVKHQAFAISEVFLRGKASDDSSLCVVLREPEKKEQQQVSAEGCNGLHTQFYTAFNTMYVYSISKEFECLRPYCF